MDIEAQRKARIELATAQQRAASNPDCSVWVEASAGTGKTKVLSDRVLRLLLKGVQPGRILCLTYTKAAAVEMNTRIAGRLSRWAVINDVELQEELEKLLGFRLEDTSKAEEIKAQARKLFAVLLDTPGGMKIQTIHSFCQEILKRFPLEAKISPYFEVMDDRTAKEAVEEVKKRLLQKIEEEPESRTARALAFITRQVSEFTFPKLMSSLTDNRSKIARLLGRYRSLDMLLAETSRRLGVSENETEEGLKQAFVSEIDVVKLKALTAALAQGSDTDRKKAVCLEAVLNSRRPEVLYDDYHTVFLTADNQPRKNIATKKALAAYPEGADFALAEAERLTETDNKIAAARLLAATRAVLFLADDLIRGYNEYKKIHSKMDYEDLIVQTRELLENPGVADWVLYKLDGGIDNVLIDEAQDTSPDQWAIIRAITNEFFNGLGAKDKNCTVFAVGDRKQSIYSFQGADPQEFERMRRYFAEELKSSGNFNEVNLEVSFRSTAAILDTVNCVFADEKAKKGVALEGQSVVHTPSRIGEGGKVELWPLIEADDGENPDIWLPPIERVTAESTSSRLAKMIAERIKCLVEGKEPLASQNRPLRYKDFMVLVQRRNSFVEEFVRACKNVGVAIAGIDKISLLEQVAVQDLVAVGKFILLPGDDLTLATILKSPLWGLTDDDLFELCYSRGDKSLWSRLGANPKYGKVYSELQTLLNMADFVRPFELYSYILNKMDGRRKFVSRIGYEAEDGIDEFVNLSLNFEQEHIPTLQLFIDWIEKDEVEIKRELEQSEADAVRIMTVHGSKGLQAPVVILPDTVRVKNIRNEAGLLLDDVMYYPFSSADFETNCKRIKEREKELSLEEYRRLLYVALTRAEERLCICGYKLKNKPSEDSWYELCRVNLERIAHDNAGNLEYEVIQERPVKPAEEIQRTETAVPDFSWLRSAAPEEGPLAKPLTPSKADEDEPALISPIGHDGKSCYRRGQIIHKLLQFLPVSESKNKGLVIEEFLRRNAADISDGDVEQIKNEVLRLLNDERFSAVFGKNSKAEVPVMGLADGRIISGQIDRLVVENDRVMIVDFKTNRPAASSPDEVPSGYLKQLKAYKALVEKIYPGRWVETYILWTDTACLMPITF